jgi:hypothetical protein
MGLCQGTSSAPTCEEPDAVCLVRDNGIYQLCSIPCDPVLQDCPSGLNCDFFFKAITCFDLSGAKAYGEHCDFFGFDCQRGLLCAAGGGGCDGADHCCTPPCHLDAPMKDAACPDAGLGQTCEPYQPNGEPLPGSENIGACVG